MMSRLFRTTFLLALPLTTLQTTTVPDSTSQAIVPFAQLPECAQHCGPLFDVEYGCIPPTKPNIDKNCFCTDPRVTAVGQAGAANTCAGACTDAADLAAVQSWYNSYCAAGDSTPTTGGNGSPTETQTGSTGTGAAGNSGDSAGNGNTGSTTPTNKSWIAGHYQYVIMIVIIVVAIVGGWIAAAFFRRRYLRKRELNYEMRPPNQPWVTGHTGPTGPYGFGESPAGKEAAMMTTPMTAAQVKKEKNKWTVGSRT